MSKRNIWIPPLYSMGIEFVDWFSLTYYLEGDDEVTFEPAFELVCPNDDLYDWMAPDSPWSDEQCINAMATACNPVPEPKAWKRKEYGLEVALRDLDQELLDLGTREQWSGLIVQMHEVLNKGNLDTSWLKRDLLVGIYKNDPDADEARLDREMRDPKLQPKVVHKPVDEGALTQELGKFLKKED